MALPNLASSNDSIVPAETLWLSLFVNWPAWKGIVLRSKIVDGDGSEAAHLDGLPVNPLEIERERPSRKSRAGETVTA